MGKLYVVGTPIGNLEDMTRRAERVLGQVSLIAAEDTRVTRKLLSHLGLHTPMISYHSRNWRLRLPRLLEQLSAGDVALVSDAGMPVVSDPGSELVAAAAQAGYEVEVVPGASAVTAAVAVSGMAGDGFVFVGFLPRQGKRRRDKLNSIASVAEPLVIFEAPHRLLSTLQNLEDGLGDRHITVCRELTKLHEEIFRGTISQARNHFTQPRGEFVLVIAGACLPSDSGESSEEKVSAATEDLTRLRATGERAKTAVAQVAESTGLPKKTVYQLWLKIAAEVSS